MASLACSLAGVSVVPLLGGLVGAVLGAAALRVIGRQPPTRQGRGMALGGLVAGTVTSFVPLMAVCYVQRDEWGPAPFILTVLATAALVAAALGSAPPGERKGVGALFGAGVVSVLAVAGVAVLMSLMLAAVVAALGEAIGDAIGEAFSDAFDTGSCGL